MPAQFTRPCRWPKAWSRKIDRGLAIVFAGHIGQSKAGSFAQFAGQRFACGAIHIGNHDKSAFGNQKPRRRRAQPRCAAGNKKT